jgi:hypothetical protein
MTAFEARFIIECLRAGIASSAVSELFSQGQGRLVSAFLDRLNGSGGAMAIEGGYGQGKTHLLKHLAQLARRRGYVVSLVPLSKETPFHHWWHVYRQAIMEAERPDVPGEPAIRGVLRQLKWDDEMVATVKSFGDGIHPRLPVVLESYCRSREPEVRHRLLGDLMGHALSNAELRRIYRSVTDERVTLPAARLSETGRDYFAFAGKLFQRAGYAGWVILFDEFELVCKLSALQRARAYANMAVFRRADLPGFDRILSVFAYIPTMVTDFLVAGRDDLNSLPGALQIRGLGVEADACRESIRWLVEQKHSLAPPSEADTVAVLDRIADLHEQAYGWRRPKGRFPPPSACARKSATASRRWIWPTCMARRRRCVHRRRRSLT